MTIPTDVIDTGSTDDNAVAALVAQMTSGKTSTPEADEDEEDQDVAEDEDNDPSDDEDNDDDSDDQDEDADEESEEEAEEPAEAAKPAEVSDDTVLSIVVDGEAQEFTVGSLKRLAGQEASLTRKSQEADIVGQRAAVTLQGALESVVEDLQPYEGVDWVLEGQRMDPEEFAWHREQFTRLSNRYNTILGNAQALEQTISTRKDAAIREQAVEAVKVLSDPTTGIPGWSDALYDDILAFAVEAGLPENEVAEITNPQVIKIINDARLYRTAQKAAGTKVDLTPKKVRKGSGSEAPASSPERRQATLEKKIASGTATDAEAQAALMGRWGVKPRR